MGKRILLIGASGHARVIADIVALNNDIVVGALSDRASDADGFPYPVLGPFSSLADVSRQNNIDAVIIAIGDNFKREQAVFSVVKALPDAAFATAVHPGAVVAQNAYIGAGTVVMAGAVVNPGAKVGTHVILNTRSSVDHDCVVADYSSLAPAAALGGNVYVGERTSIGIGAVVIHGVRIGSDTVVGAGAAVVQDLPDKVVALGVPARIQREREQGELYL